MLYGSCEISISQEPCICTIMDFIFFVPIPVLCTQCLGSTILFLRVMQISESEYAEENSTGVFRSAYFFYQMWNDSHLCRWRVTNQYQWWESIPIWYSRRQDCRDAQKKYVMHCMTCISQQECRGILELKPDCPWYVPYNRYKSERVQVSRPGSVGRWKIHPFVTRHTVLTDNPPM